MSDEIEIAKYQFHSWSRKGIAATINETDDLGAGTSTVKERSTVTVSLKLNSTSFPKDFELIGPGDITGINRDMIVRTEPLNWITDFEPNYLAFVEFYDEDFVWRYTPAAPHSNDPLDNAHSRLRPWLFLLVLKASEFDRTGRKIPLATVNIRGADAFPPANETWLWAHVHSNASIPRNELTTYEQFLQLLNNTMNDDPDQLYCRLMSPRKLEINTEYFAFIVPAFETGRLAGLGLATTDVNAQMSSWSSAGANGEMPVYFEWQFRTGVHADFESLVKLLVPRAVDSRVGIRDMDCSSPGFVKSNGTVPFPGTEPAVIGLEGALRSPETVSTEFPHSESTNQFQKELEKLVNLPVNIIGTHDSGDPVISVPFYGALHAKTNISQVVLLDITDTNWYNDLNKDPRTRVSAGLGTQVIQKNQETYMRKAWEQVDRIIAANRAIRLTTLYMKVALFYQAKTIASFPSSVLLAICKPLLKRIMGGTRTIHQQIRESVLPGAALSPSFRRVIRPNNKFVLKIAGVKKFPYSSLITDLNRSDIKPAPPRKIPRGVPNTKVLADKIYRPDLSAANAAGFIALSSKSQDKAASESILDPRKELRRIPAVPASPKFNILLDDERTRPSPTRTTPGKDSVEARHFREALTDLDSSLSVNARDPEATRLVIATASQRLRTAINPNKSYPVKLTGSVKLPGGIDTTKHENIFPAIAYPDFEDPMYKGLTAISDEFLLPNLQLIPNNTISLLKTNQPFIESYMVGLNHEMGRELLWREFPTDQRGSYFRQFWDVKGLIRPATTETPAELAEEYKDIYPIHTWGEDSRLGSHNKRASASGGDGLVLLIRGELLKRYPNTILFAQKAKKAGNDLVIELNLDDAGFRKKMKFPLYKAEISPDIKLYGFDLTIEQARGSALSPDFPGDRHGWFFVIQQMPGEPRFGMDISTTSDVATSWDDLAWDQFSPALSFIKATQKPSIDPQPMANWGQDAASMAHILFQKPSMVAVHAKDMLENLTT